VQHVTRLTYRLCLRRAYCRLFCGLRTQTDRNRHRRCFSADKAFSKSPWNHTPHWARSARLIVSARPLWGRRKSMFPGGTASVTRADQPVRAPGLLKDHFVKEHAGASGPAGYSLRIAPESTSACAAAPRHSPTWRQRVASAPRFANVPLTPAGSQHCTGARLCIAASIRRACGMPVFDGAARGHRRLVRWRPFRALIFEPTRAAFRCSRSRASVRIPWSAYHGPTAPFYVGSRPASKQRSTWAMASVAMFARLVPILRFVTRLLTRPALSTTSFRWG